MATAILRHQHYMDQQGNLILVTASHAALNCSLRVYLSSLVFTTSSQRNNCLWALLIKTVWTSHIVKSGKQTEMGQKNKLFSIKLWKDKKKTYIYTQMLTWILCNLCSSALCTRLSVHMVNYRVLKAMTAPENYWLRPQEVISQYRPVSGI